LGAFALVANADMPGTVILQVRLLDVEVADAPRGPASIRDELPMLTHGHCDASSSWWGRQVVAQIRSVSTGSLQEEAIGNTIGI
jgi:hypothetical protein